MKAIKLLIDNKTDSSRIHFDEDIQRLQIEFSGQLQDYEKERLWSSVGNKLYRFIQRNRSLRILDLTGVEGITEFHYDLYSIHELYLPNSVKLLWLDPARELRYIKATGVKKIHINRAPKLTRIDFGQNLSEICLAETGISEISLPNGCELSALGAFKNCKDLIYADVSRIKNIPAGCFAGCTKLQKVILPDIISKLEADVFKNCKNLTTICGGKNITQISNNSFTGCPSLEIIDKWKVFRDENTHQTQNIEKQIRTNYFHKESNNQIGYIVFAKEVIIIWSLTNRRFYVINNIKYSNTGERAEFRDFIVFSITESPYIHIDDVLNIQHCIEGDTVTKFEKLITKDENLALEIEEQEMILKFSLKNESYEDFCNRKGYEIDNLKIDEIIESYTINRSCHWQSRPGRDDSEWYYSKTSCIYSDAYIDKLLPKENISDYTSSYSSRPYDEEEHNRKLQETANDEAEKRKNNARLRYSKYKHLGILCKSFIEQRNEVDTIIKKKYYLEEVENFIYPDIRYVENIDIYRLLRTVSEEDVIHLKSIRNLIMK